MASLLNLLWANIDGATLHKADLTYGNLNNTTLCQTNLRQALMVGIKLKDALFDTIAKWPKHFYLGLAGAKQITPLQIPAQVLLTPRLPEHRDASLR